MKRVVGAAAPLLGMCILFLMGTRKDMQSSRRAGVSSLSYLRRLEKLHRRAQEIMRAHDIEIYPQTSVRCGKMIFHTPKKKRLFRIEFDLRRK